VRKRWGWIVASGVLIVVIAGLAYPLVATAHDDVGFCTTCHIMEKEGQTHATSRHKDVATCSQCHTGSLVQKYMDGARHVYANITGDHPNPIVIRDASKKVVDQNCYACHYQKSLHVRTKKERGASCVECHTGHDPRPIKFIK